MRDVFLSYRYDDVNTKLAKENEELLQSHNLAAVTGDTLGGEIVTPEVLKQIEEADAFIAMLTRREQLAKRRLDDPSILPNRTSARTDGE